MSKQCITVGIV